MASYEYDSQNQELKRIAGGTLYADMAIGSEIEYAGTTAPTGFLKCDGSTYSQVTYPELYAILGTTTLPNKSGYIIKAKQIGVPADFASAIEDVIDEKFSYSTSEINTGKKWISGQPIYRKTIDCDYLPNAGNKTVAHNISGFDQAIKVFGIATSAFGNNYPLPYVTLANELNINLFVDKTNIELSTGIDRSAFYCYVTIEYTKTTD